jgi:hypothetical protein
VDERSVLTELVQRGRRRRLLQIVSQQLSLAAAVAFLGCILLLLLGTQILDWYWPVALFAASFAVGLWRTRSEFPSGYQVARSIDQHLKLNDSISTAFYFMEHPGQASSPPEIVERQRAAAEEHVRTADLRLGLPFVAPRSIYACAALAMAAFGIFAIRYGVTRSLDLRPSLVRIAFDGFFGSPTELAEAKRKQPGRPGTGNQQDAKSIDPSQTEMLDQNQSQENAQNTIEAQQTAAENGADPADAKAGAKGEENLPQDQADAGEKGDRSSPESESGKASEKGGSQSKPDGAQKEAGNSASTSGDNSSLSDKVRDALANLLSTLKMQPKKNDNKQSASNSQNASQSAQRQAANKDQKGSQDSGKAQNTESSASDSEGEQAQNGDQSLSSQGNSSRKNSDRASSQDGKSGIGKEDGDKSIREAEQLAAMGKISEIIGKRAQAVTGEVMVEVASGKQQLKTQYTQRNATHGEAGSQIDRDEVPLAYQQYVQQYFEEIRKLPAGKSAKSKTPGS